MSDVVAFSEIFLEGDLADPGLENKVVTNTDNDPSKRKK